jgi:hypothetical protein
MQISTIHLGVLVLVGVSVVTVGAATTDFGGGEPLQVEAVEETSPNEESTALTVAATLDNTGGTDVSRSVALLVDTNGSGTPSTTIAERRVSVASGTSERVAFDIQVGALDPGTYAYALVVGGDASVRANGTLTLDPPRYVLTETTAPSAVRGDDATVTATVRNAGDFRGMRTVELRLDRDHDGDFDDEAVAATAAPTIRSGASADVELAGPTDGLEPGTYDYQLASPDETVEGTLEVLQPATFRFDRLDGPHNVTRGETVNVSVELTNEGDVAADRTVSFDRPGEATENRSVRLAGSESTTLEYTVETAPLDRGNYSIAVATSDDRATAPLRVRESHFEVSAVRGEQTVTRGDALQFTAVVHNTGDAADNQTVAYRFDMDGDDTPDPVGAAHAVSLAPGERTTVDFTVEYSELAEEVGWVGLAGSHVHGVYTEDDNRTSVVAYDQDVRSAGSDDEASAGSSEPDPVSLDEITQAKYGLDYDRLSAETRRQVEEIHERQPFAGSLVLTEVLTREEIARQRFGLDVARGDEFDFAGIDIETQQRVEAAFDAQFRSDTGDRIESWDELARQRYDSDYDSLTAERKRTIRERYLTQFEEA